MQVSVLHKSNEVHTQKDLSVFFEDRKEIVAAIKGSINHIGNATIREASAHLLTAGGKMLRSSLVTTCYKAVGGNDMGKILYIAAAIELVHNWSLVHDDIIDRSLTRRGVATVHEKWNTNIAILTGDALNNLAYLLIARSGFPARLINNVMECVAGANLELIDGELMDVEFETRNDVTERDYFEMIRKKTGALIKSAVKIGAMLGTDKQSIINAIEDYGDRIGIAFQIKDDLLDVTSSEEETGKDFAGDIKEGKKTILLLHTLRNASTSQAERISEIISGATVTMDDRLEAIDIMRKAGSLDYSQRMLAKLISEATQSLMVLPASHYVTALAELAEFIFKRNS